MVADRSLSNIPIISRTVSGLNGVHEPKGAHILERGMGQINFTGKGGGGDVSVELERHIRWQGAAYGGKLSGIQQ